MENQLRLNWEGQRALTVGARNKLMAMNHDDTPRAVVQHYWYLQTKESIYLT